MLLRDKCGHMDGVPDAAFCACAAAGCSAADDFCGIGPDEPLDADEPCDWDDAGMFDACDYAAAAPPSPAEPRTSSTHAASCAGGAEPAADVSAANRAVSPPPLAPPRHATKPLFAHQAPCRRVGRKWASLHGDRDLTELRASLCARHDPPLDPASEAGKRYLSRFDGAVMKRHVAPVPAEVCTGSPLSCLDIGTGGKYSTAAEEATGWADCFLMLHKLVKERTNHIHECTYNCWKYLTSTDKIRICRHRFWTLTRLRLPVDFVEVVLRTDAEKLAFIDNTNMKKNPNGFILDHDFAVRQWDSPTLGARGYPKLRKGMFVATFGG
eukprot:gene13238-18879_t